jgi:hypothetical protein
VSGAEIPEDFMGTIDFASLVQTLDALAGQHVCATLVLLASGARRTRPNNDTSIQVEGTLRRRRLPDDAEHCLTIGDSARLNLDEADFVDADLFTNGGHDDFTVFVHLRAATLFLWGDRPARKRSTSSADDRA